VIPVLQRAFDLPSVKAIILSIDSPGGAPVETERIYRAMDEMRKENPKPVIAVINNMGASAAYLLAIHADQIYAGKYSLVGSVGAVIAGWDLHKAMDKVDVSQRIYASGKLKAMLNPFIPSNPAADAKAQSLVDAMGGSFKAEVMKARQGKLLPNVNYTTGEVWNGVDAKRIGLVDGIGTIEEVAKKKWNLDTYDFGPYPSQMHLPFMKSMARELVRSVFGMDSTGGFSVR
jgi:protease-4